MDANVAAIEVSETEYLRLAQFERFDDGSGYKCLVSARSGEYGCFGKVFYFDDLPRIVAGLRDMYQSLGGQVELRQRHERESIAFSCTARGHIVVKLELTDYRDSQLRLTMEVDQTFVQPLVSSLERISAGFTPNNR